jgi:cysteine-rich repeat protein
VDGSQVDGSQVDSAVDAETVDAAEPDAAVEECGDGVIQAGEVCDDGNVQDGDGCDSGCQVEQGFDCTGEPSVCTSTCGDGVVASDESCDDGNQVSGDGCNTACEVDCSNESTTDCNPAGETLDPASAFVDDQPPAGFVQCAGFVNTNGNDVAADWDANCLGEVSLLRVRYWDTSGQPWTLLGDATLDPTSLATYQTQVFDAVNHAGTQGFLATQGVTLLKDEPASPTVTAHVCNPSHPAKEYAATDLYFGDESDTNTIFVCGYSSSDGNDAQCADHYEIHMVLASYVQDQGCTSQQLGATDLAIAIYHEVGGP